MLLNELRENGVLHIEAYVSVLSKSGMILLYVK